MAAPAANSKPKAALVVRHDLDRPSNFWRLFPAAIGSVVFHVGLIALLLLLSSFTEAQPARETEKQNEAMDEKETVKSTPQPKPPESNDPFVTTDVDPARQEFDTDIKSDAERKAEITIPEMVRPSEAVGVETGLKDAPPISAGPALGLGNTGGSGGVGGGIDMSAGAGLPGVGLGAGTGGIPKGVPLAGSIYGRSGATKEFALRQGGGTGESEAAVARGLRWLVINQTAEGTWTGCGNDVAGAAFGLLPLLGSGHTHKAGPKNPYDKPILKALQYLMKKQNKKGDFGAGMYAQGLATIAMCEAYGLSQDPLLRRPAQLAVDYIVWAQHDAGGWRYGPKQPGDTSVVGWQVMALKSGMMSGLDVPEATMKKAIRYLEDCCSESEGYGYVGKGGSPAMSAVGLLCRQYLQAWGPRNPRMMKGVANHIIGKNHGVRDMYYTYYATQVMHHFGGKPWDDWNKRTRDELIATQNKTNGPDGGSWDPGQGGHVNGRIMITSLCLLTLEVYYRHLPLYYRDSGEKMKG